MLTKGAQRDLGGSQYGTNLFNFQLRSILGQHNGKDLMARRINLFLILRVER